jgi:protein-tyrosine-phosphatase
VTSHVRELRRRLGRHGARIETVRGVGYHYAAGGPAPAGAAPPARVRLLFLEAGNACWSQVAEAFARLLGMGRAKVASAGASPWAAVHPEAARAMWEVGYDLARHRPKAPEALPGGDYDLAVVLGGAGGPLPARARRREDWGLPDPEGLTEEGFRAVRDWIERKVEKFLGQL